MSAALTKRIIRFGRHLRVAGLSVAPSDGALLLEAAAIVGLASRVDLRAALCSVAVRNRDEIEIFDAAFEMFFGSFEVTVPGHVQSLPETAAGAGVPLEGEGDSDGAVVLRVGGSHEERLSRRDFAEMDQAALDEVKRRLAAMVWRPAETRSRRWEPARVGVQPDLRRSFRSWVGPTGDLMLMSSRRRRRRRRPLVVLADVSGSMERYVEVLLAFMHAARDRLGKLEAFVFSTRLTRITRQLAVRDVADALAAVALEVQDWSGGTRIGEALQAFNRDWSRRVTRGGPVCLIVSDGWDTGDPDLLAAEMGRLARSVHRVIWLNPLAGRSGYEPVTRGMKAVMPHVDDLLPVANLADVAEVVRLLESIPARR